MTDYCSSEATPYKSVEPQGAGAVWHGLWGRHYFTPGNLELRAQAYWNRWSEDWKGYDYIQFRGGWVYIPQVWTTTWMINFNEYLQVQLKDYNPKVSEDRWAHPGILLNDPQTHIIYPPNQVKRNKYYKIKLRPPDGWRGMQRLPDATSYVCCHWVWSWCDLREAFFNSALPQGDNHVSVCEQSPWWGENAKLNKWVDRQTYERCLTQEKKFTWGPFLPCKYNGLSEQSLWFQYKLYFKVAGTSLWPALPRNIVSEGLVPQPPGAQSTEVQPQTRKSSKKRSRPQSQYDIWAGDLDSDGLLKDRAYQRITAPDPGDERREMERQRRLKHLTEKLERILDDRKLLKRRRMGEHTRHPPKPPL